MTAIEELVEEIDELDALAQDLGRRSEQLRAKLRAFKASVGKKGQPVYVEHHRLTEAGVRYCEAAFRQGRGPSEIARTLGVTVPAIVMRRKRWLKKQGRG